MPDPADGAPAVDDAQVRDGRSSPWCFQTHAALDLIRASFDGPKRSTALAVYVCLTEAANRSGGAAARGGFTASRADIAAAAGISVDTLDRYAAEFSRVGLITVERRRHQGVNLPNRWVLADPSPPPVPPLAARVRPGGSRVGAAQVLKKKPLAKKGETTSPLGEGPPGPGAPGPDIEVPPPLTLVEERNLGWDAIAEVCGIDPASPRSGLVAVSLNGARGQVGIRHLFWREVYRWADAHGEMERLSAITAERFEEALAQGILKKAELYRQRLPGATLTPTALRAWWLDLEKTPHAGGGGLTPDEIAAFEA
jgi:hypothetical protein